MTRLGAADAGAQLLPLIWLAATASWLVVLVVTDWPAWPLAVWIAATVGLVTGAARHRRGGDAPRVRGH